jgi:hypothetical protein
MLRAIRLPETNEDKSRGSNGAPAFVLSWSEESYELNDAHLACYPFRWNLFSGADLNFIKPLGVFRYKDLPYMSTVNRLLFRQDVAGNFLVRAYRES